MRKTPFFSSRVRVGGVEAQGKEARGKEDRPAGEGRRRGGQKERKTVRWSV